MSKSLNKHLARKKPNINFKRNTRNTQNIKTELPDIVRPTRIRSSSVHVRVYDTEGAKRKITSVTKNRK